jgi:hypothetical protein
MAVNQSFQTTEVMWPNVMVEWLTLLRRIQEEVPVSNFGPQPAIVSEAFRVFSQSFQSNAGIVP